MMGDVGACPQAPRVRTTPDGEMCSPARAGYPNPACLANCALLSRGAW